QQANASRSGAFVSNLYGLLHVGHEKRIGFHRIPGVCFDRVPYALSRRRKQNYGLDVCRQPRSEIAVIEIAFVSTEDERLDVSSQRIERSERGTGHGRNRIIVELHTVVSSNRLQPMRQGTKAANG